MQGRCSWTYAYLCNIYGVTDECEHLLRTRRAYDIYWNLNHGMTAPTSMGPKSTHTGRALGIPMINK